MKTKKRIGKKVGIVVNIHKKSATRLLGQIESWLKRRGFEVKNTSAHSLDEVLKDASFAVCLGGDGTLLSLSHEIAKPSIPVLGVNLGSLGFLTEVKQNEVFDELDAFLRGDAVIEERLMLACAVLNREGKTEQELVALNDIVISREGLSRILRVEVCVGSEKLTSFSGDGVIVATPTGSTAYSLSAGGAVVHPKLDAIVITPICPHASALRSMVVAESEKITVRILPHHTHTKALLTADGQENVEIDDSYSVVITRSDRRLRLVKSSKRSYVETLRENFKFPAQT